LQVQSTKHDDNVPFVSSAFFNDLTRQWREEAEVARARHGVYYQIRLVTMNPKPHHFPFRPGPSGGEAQQSGHFRCQRIRVEEHGDSRVRALHRRMPRVNASNTLR
jgi:hypothetical protein